MLKILFPFLVLTFLLSACSGEAPTLGVADMPTLIFIYTDG